jgi:hypothetical protein
VVGAILMTGRERAWWVGFAVFAGGSLYLSVGPWVGDAFREQLVTTHWIGEIRNRMFPTNVEYLLGEKLEIEAELAKRRPSTPNVKYDPVVATLTYNLRSIEAQLTASRASATASSPSWPAWWAGRSPSGSGGDGRGGYGHPTPPADDAAMEGRGGGRRRRGVHRHRGDRRGMIRDVPLLPVVARGSWRLTSR